MNNHVQDDNLVLWHEPDKHELLSIGEIVVLTGVVGVGKSWLAFQLACAAEKAMHKNMDRGTACGISVRGGEAAMANYYERKHYSVDYDPHFFPAHKKGPLYTMKENGAGRTEWWELMWDEQCKGVIEPVLVVIDPVCAAVESTSDEIDEVTCGFMGALAEEAAAIRCGVLVVSHDTGSPAWHDRAARVLHMAEEDSGERVLRCIETGWEMPLTDCF